MPIKAKILSRKTVDMMTTNHIGTLAINGKGNKFGLGFEIINHPGATGTPVSQDAYRWGGMYYTDYVIDPAENLILLFYTNVQPYRGPNFMALAGHFKLQCPGEPARALVAEKRNYVGSSMPMTESAIRWGLTRDLYVALGEPLDGSPHGAWSVRVQHKPFMRWVWIGAVLMALGAAVAAGARRYRPRRAVAHEPQRAEVGVQTAQGWS